MAPNPNPYPSGSGATAPNPSTTYQHIQDMTAKRLSTLDYIRKTHEGKIYWLNSLHFSKDDILRLASYQAPRLARRAANYLFLSVSIPQALDGSASSALEYVRALNALLAEFEAYQQLHPPEGGTNSLGSGSFSRPRIPKMFSRTHTGGKSRRASTATDIGLPLPPGFDSADVAAAAAASATGLDSLANSTASLDTGGGGGGTATAPAQAPAHATALPAPDATLLLPGEEYALLLTPSLPFEPDFFEVWATLADAMIDVYLRIGQLASSPERVALQPGLYEAFQKADARVRKMLVVGFVREFEDATKAGVRLEMKGVGMVVLGGLM